MPMKMMQRLNVVKYAQTREDEEALEKKGYRAVGGMPEASAAEAVPQKSSRRRKGDADG